VIVTVNGCECYVGSGGVQWQADRPSILFMHGAGLNRTVWVLLARYYARHGFNVVVPDLPGHGASAGKALGSIEEQASFLWELLQVLQSEHKLPSGKLTLCGHSMGSLIVSEAARQSPTSVAQLILLGAGYPMPVGAALLNAAKANDQAAVDMIAIFAHCIGSQIGHNMVGGISVVNSAMALLEQARDDVLYTDLNACNDYHGLDNAGDVFSGFKCTIIAGVEDKMAPLKAANNMAALLGAECVALENCGHMMMSEQPEKTHQALLKLLNDACCLPARQPVVLSSSLKMVSRMVSTLPRPSTLI